MRREGWWDSSKPPTTPPLPGLRNRRHQRRLKSSVVERIRKTAASK